MMDSHDGKCLLVTHCPSEGGSVLVTLREDARQSS